MFNNNRTPVEAQLLIRQKGILQCQFRLNQGGIATEVVTAGGTDGTSQSRWHRCHQSQKGKREIHEAEVPSTACHRSCDRCNDRLKLESPYTILTLQPEMGLALQIRRQSSKAWALQLDDSIKPTFKAIQRRPLARMGQGIVLKSSA